MFHLISCRRKLLQISSNPIDSTPHFPFFLLLQQNPSSIKPFSNISTNNPTETQTPSSSFTLSYLINSCGLSPRSALSTSQKIQLKSPQNPDSVLTLLKNHGFTNTQVTTVITKWPRILLANPDKTLLPKLQFFHGLGIPGPILTKIVSSNPCTLTHSLKNQIIPSIDYIKSYVHTNEGVIYCIQCATRILQFNVQKEMEPKIRILRDYGIPKSNILRLIMIRPTVLILSAERLNEIVSMVKEMGLNPSSGNFILAIKVKMMSRLKWERKVTFYRSCGWSEDEFLSTFKLQPYFMASSEYKIKRVMSFFTNEMGWKPSDLSRYPNFLLLSLEKRIVPRCSVLKILMSKGLVKDSSISTALTISNKAFIERFIAKYQDSVPEIPTVYQGKMGFLGLDVKSEDAGRALKL